jgi:hypothetical protein
LTVQGLVERDAKRELIGAHVDIGRLMLLRRHVAWRPHDRAGVRERRVDRNVGRAHLDAIDGDKAEVCDAHAAVVTD